jgi:hypothetical protein
MRRCAPLAAAVVALAIGGALQAEGRVAGGKSFQVHMKPTSSTFVDNDPIGAPANTIGPGDTQQLAENAFSRGAKVGRTLVACTVVTKALDSECAFTLRLAKGDIQYAGFGTIQGTERFAIIGGTGIYSRARGYVVAKASRANGLEHDLTFHLQ